MTVKDLCSKLTIEEMIGWAAFYEIRNDNFKKEENKVQRRSVIPRSR